MLGKVLDFLFGKAPEIFDNKGEVRHNLPKEKWDSWHKRYTGGEEYNWRNHIGTRAGTRSNQGSTTKAVADKKA